MWLAIITTITAIVAVAFALHQLHLRHKAERNLRNALRRDGVRELSRRENKRLKTKGVRISFREMQEQQPSRRSTQKDQP